MPLYYVWLLCKCYGDSEQKPLIWASLWLEQLTQQKHHESNRKTGSGMQCCDCKWNWTNLITSPAM